MFLRKSNAKNEDSKPSSGLFFKPRVQLKMKTGESNDKYEQEADRVADKVVNNAQGDSVQKKDGEEEIQQKPIASEVTPYVQKMESADDEPVQKVQEEEPIQKAEEEEAAQMKEEEPVQMKEEEESVQKAEEEEPIQKVEEEEAVQMQEEEESVQKAEEEEVQKKAEEEEAVQMKPTAGNSQSTSIESRLNSSKGSGQKLSGDTKNEMESGFGADFSNVNIHTDQNAAQMSQELGAKAFAHGNDVYFNKGQYNPQSSEGKHLLAHELTHTIQQKGMVQKQVQKASKKLNDHDKGFLNVKNEASGTPYPLSYNAEVDFKNASGGREYFTAQEWPHRGEKSSVKGSGRFITGGYNGPAVVKFWKSKNLLKFGNGIIVKAHSMASDPVPTGTHDLMLPDYPHTFGYLSDSDFSYAWFRIGESSSRYLHIGNVTLGCVTVGASETGAPEDRKKWTAIYKYLINSRAGNNKSVGKIYVYD